MGRARNKLHGPQRLARRTAAFREHKSMAEEMIYNEQTTRVELYDELIVLSSGPQVELRNGL
jgi:hypothetical protein